MLENIPSQSVMTELLGQSLFEVWQGSCLYLSILLNLMNT